MKLTKSLPVIKERNCNASLVLDTRTNRKNVSEYPPGNANIEVAKEDKSFIGIWQEYIYHLQNDDNGN